jgi:hypothetical protein
MLFAPANNPFERVIHNPVFADLLSDQATKTKYKVVFDLQVRFFVWRKS